MHRRLVVVMGALAALLIPFASASADLAPIPSGSYAHVYAAPVCVGADCVEMRLDFIEVTGTGPDWALAQGPLVCVYLNYTSSGEDTNSESGCSDSNTTFGTRTYDNGWLVGIGGTAITVTDSSSSSRSVTVSADFATTGSVSRQNVSATFPDEVDPACTVRYLARDRSIGLIGAAIVGGDTYSSVGATTNRVATFRIRCH